MRWLSSPIPPCEPWSPPPDLDTTETVEKGHGRIEIRRLEATESLAAHLNAWPGVAQVCRITRHRIIGDKESTETVFAITSLQRSEASAAALLALTRAHWGIENRLHYVRDVTLREDACQIRTGNTPQVFAALRNTILTVFRRLGFRPVEGREHFAENRPQAINYLLTGRTE